MARIYAVKAPGRVQDPELEIDGLVNDEIATVLAAAISTHPSMLSWCVERDDDEYEDDEPAEGDAA